MTPRHRNLIAVVASSLCAVGAARGQDEAAALKQSTSALKERQLQMLWNAAQKTGSVIAIEPESEILGTRAAKKKTWAVADMALKLFWWGFQPNWFPVDVVRRTACGTNPRWAYFWHLASGEERDLHPWMDGMGGFEHLVGTKNTALVRSGSLDLSNCSDVYDEKCEKDEAGKKKCRKCLYGEVTPPEGFEAWFCGGRGDDCWREVSRAPAQAPPDLVDPELLCVHGPFVLERAHDWRPEIHPAEVMWVRKKADLAEWTFALIPDESDRFQKDKYFDEPPQQEPKWKPWSRNRPVELWVAFSSSEEKGVAFDLIVKKLGKKADPARQVVLQPVSVGPDFAILSHSMDSVTVATATRTWRHDSEIRGLIVLRTQTLNSSGSALVIRLRGREPGSPQVDAVDAELLPGIDQARAHGPVAPPKGGRSEPVDGKGSVRLLLSTGEEPRPDAIFTVSALVRFDPLRPAVPADEQLADKLNEALRGKPEDWVRTFGTDRPFRVRWTIETEGVPVIGFRGRGTSAVEVFWQRTERLDTIGRERGAYPLGCIDVAAPVDPPLEYAPGRPEQPMQPAEAREASVLGSVEVVYNGQGVGEDIGLQEMAFALPYWVPQRRRTYSEDPLNALDAEWRLVKDVLGEIDMQTSARRRDELMQAACWPETDERKCKGTVLAASVAEQLADPTKRYEVLLSLREGDRAFARFVRHYAKAMLWDGAVDRAEWKKLKGLLEAAYR